MSMLQLNLNPSPKTLRQFGAASLVMLSVLGLFLKWRFGWGWVVVAGFITAGMILFEMSMISVRFVRPIYVVVMLIGFPIGWVISHLVMILFFFCIITPVALVFRLLGRDVLCRRWDRQAESYWVRYPRPDSVKRYFRQF